MNEDTDTEQACLSATANNLDKYDDVIKEHLEQLLVALIGDHTLSEHIMYETAATITNSMTDNGATDQIKKLIVTAIEKELWFAGQGR